MLSEYGGGNKQALEDWRKRVGDREADRITNTSARGGTGMHRIAENYVANKADYFKGEMPINIKRFKAMQPEIDRLEEVYGIEQRLISHRYRMGGTADLVAKIGGLRTLIDYKTSRRKKRKSWIKNYFLQSTCYCIMLEEMFNFRMQQIGIFIVNSDTYTADYYYDTPHNWIKDPYFKRIMKRED